MQTDEAMTREWAPVWNPILAPRLQASGRGLSPQSLALTRGALLGRGVPVQILDPH